MGSLRLEMRLFPGYLIALKNNNLPFRFEEITNPMQKSCIIGDTIPPGYIPPLHLCNVMTWLIHRHATGRRGCVRVHFDICHAHHDFMVKCKLSGTWNVAKQHINATCLKEHNLARVNLDHFRDEKHLLRFCIWYLYVEANRNDRVHRSIMKHEIHSCTAKWHLVHISRTLQT